MNLHSNYRFGLDLMTSRKNNSKKEAYLVNFFFPCLLSSYPYLETCCLCICFNLHFMYIASGFLVLILVVVLFIFNILVLQACLLVFYSNYSCYSNRDCCWELHLSQVVWISVIFTNNFGSDVCPHYMRAWELLKCSEVTKPHYTLMTIETCLCVTCHYFWWH